MAEGQIQHSPVGAFFLLYTLFRRCENWKVPVLGRVRLKPTSFLLRGWANWHKTCTCNRVQCFWLFLFCAADVLYYSNFQKILINLFNYSIGMYCWKAYTASELITHVMKLSWTKRFKKKNTRSWTKCLSAKKNVQKHSENDADRQVRILSQARSGKNSRSSGL